MVSSFGVSVWLLAVILSLSCQSVPLSNFSQSRNEAPIIGVLAQPLDELVQEPMAPKLTRSVDQYIESSHVKFLQSGGARVVPILFGLPQEFYFSLMGKLNGIYIPGGSTNLINPPHEPTAYMTWTSWLFDLAKEKNDKGIYFPVYGVCQGIQQLSIYRMKSPVMDTFKAVNVPMAFTVQPVEQKESRLFRGVSDRTFAHLEETIATTHLHTNGTLAERFYAEEGLQNFYNLLSVDQDLDGATFINVIEGKHYPFYGVQFHPEMPPYAFGVFNVPHNEESIFLAQHFSKFFVDECRCNNQSFSDRLEELVYSIHNFPPTHITWAEKPLWNEIHYFNSQQDYQSLLQKAEEVL
mmetsp:Transcript_49009/g.56338  ORF Transcript_49009/g.56338 Transcript_49009/m.56338 type:complete len:352 (+) Transcript_49009:72-1127(+)